MGRGREPQTGRGERKMDGNGNTASKMLIKMELSQRTRAFPTPQIHSKIKWIVRLLISEKTKSESAEIPRTDIICVDK